MRSLERICAEKRTHCPLNGSAQKGHFNDRHISYKRFRRRIVQRQNNECPVESTPLATGRQYPHCLEFDTVRQRLALDSPPRDQTSQPAAEIEGSFQGTNDDINNLSAMTAFPASPETAGAFHHDPVTTEDTPGGRPKPRNALEQDWVWTVSGHGHGNCDLQDNVSGELKPFAVLNATLRHPRCQAELAAPELLNDYYANLLDCSCDGMVALGLGSSVYLWDLETHSLEGHLHPRPPSHTPAHPGPAHPGPAWHRQKAISSVCFSGDGRVLSVGTRKGEIQLWDVERKYKVRSLLTNLSWVGSLSWKQHLLSSGSALGHIHHHDPRAPTPLVGVAVQQGGVCSLQWSPGGDRLASGSTEGILNIWNDDVARCTGAHAPVATLRQPSAVKAMGWCPWQRQLIATGGGWKDGELRIWDTQSEACVSSAHTNSQICSLLWSEQKRVLITGHGLPHHRIICWNWDCPSLRQQYELTGHSHRVLHLALSPRGSNLVSAAADRRVRIWVT